jgi:hypothetical protein
VSKNGRIPRPWAYECTLCHHLVSRHRASPAQCWDVVAGPYRCLDCRCYISQETPVIDLTRAQCYDRHGEILARQRAEEAAL